MSTGTPGRSSVNKYSYSQLRFSHRRQPQAPLFIEGTTDRDAVQLQTHKPGANTQAITSTSRWRGRDEPKPNPNPKPKPPANLSPPAPAPPLHIQDIYWHQPTLMTTSTSMYANSLLATPQLAYVQRHLQRPHNQGWMQDSCNAPPSSTNFKNNLDGPNREDDIEGLLSVASFGATAAARSTCTDVSAPPISFRGVARVAKQNHKTSSNFAIAMLHTMHANREISGQMIAVDSIQTSKKYSPSTPLSKSISKPQQLPGDHSLSRKNGCELESNGDVRASRRARVRRPKTAGPRWSDNTTPSSTQSSALPISTSTTTTPSTPSTLISQITTRAASNKVAIARRSVKRPATARSRIPCANKGFEADTTVVQERRRPCSARVRGDHKSKARSHSHSHVRVSTSSTSTSTSTPTLTSTSTIKPHSSSKAKQYYFEQTVKDIASRRENVQKTIASLNRSFKLDFDFDRLPRCISDSTKLKIEFMVPKKHLSDSAKSKDVRALCYLAPLKLELAFQLSTTYVGKHGANPRGPTALRDSRSRYNGVLEFLTHRKPVLTSIVTLEGGAAVRFVDGKHRFCVFRDLGLRCVPVLVPRLEKDAFDRRFGATKASIKIAKLCTIMAGRSKAQFSQGHNNWCEADGNHHTTNNTNNTNNTTTTTTNNNIDDDDDDDDDDENDDDTDDDGDDVDAVECSSDINIADATDDNDNHDTTIYNNDTNNYNDNSTNNVNNDDVNNNSNQQ